MELERRKLPKNLRRTPLNYNKKASRLTVADGMGVCISAMYMCDQQGSIHVILCSSQFMVTSV